MALDNFGRKKNQREVGKQEVFKVNLSCSRTAEINPEKWNKVFHKSGFLPAAKGVPAVHTF